MRDCAGAAPSGAGVDLGGARALNALMRLPASIERLLNEMAARYGVDASGMAAGVRSRLESRLPLSPLPLEGDLAEKVSRLGHGRVRTVAFEGPRLRKLVLTEMSFFPVVEGFAITALPRHEVRAPAFAGDFMLLPSALMVNADVYGAPPETRGVLAPLAASFDGLESTRPASWAAALASGEGLHARVSPRLVGEAYGALTAALGAFLDALAAASEEPGRSDEQERFFQLMHAHGPRGRSALLFGAEWAERYSRLLFE